ncbi:hypothetical protein M0813_24867 [Anaeramoeba flamelloides]|uniref:Uncharacterized protein n=1 Tax=Anaeramoeba flamelloides TaxID=1746091 RepID=A0ABQ8Y4Y0_9EUKA|nr:hypothetical protein M0813_24867 [Anaeramoeba flamelloides]
MSIFDNDLPTFSLPTENDFLQDSTNAQSISLSSALNPSPFLEQDHDPKESIQNMYPFENDYYFTSLPPLQDPNITRNVNTKDPLSKKAEGFEFGYDQDYVNTNEFCDDSTNLSSFNLFDSSKEHFTILDFEKQQNGFENQALPKIEEMKSHKKQNKERKKKKKFLKKDPLSKTKSQPTKNESQFEKNSNFVHNTKRKKSILNEKPFPNYNKTKKNNYFSQPTPSSSYKQLSQSGGSITHNNLKVTISNPDQFTHPQTKMEENQKNHFGILFNARTSHFNKSPNQLISRKRKKILKCKKNGQYFYFSNRRYGENLEKNSTQNIGYKVKKRKKKRKNKYKTKTIEKEKKKKNSQNKNQAKFKPWQIQKKKSAKF